MELKFIDVASRTFFFLLAFSMTRRAGRRRSVTTRMWVSLTRGTLIPGGQGVSPVIITSSRTVIKAGLRNQRLPILSTTSRDKWTLRPRRTMQPRQCTACFKVNENYTFIVKPKSILKSKSQIQFQNPGPKSKVQRKGTGTGADTIILQATHPPTTTHNFSHVKFQSSDGKRPSMIFLDLPWHSITFYDLLPPSKICMTFYD